MKTNAKRACVLKGSVELGQRAGERIVVTVVVIVTDQRSSRKMESYAEESETMSGKDRAAASEKKYWRDRRMDEKVNVRARRRMSTSDDDEPKIQRRMQTSVKNESG